MKISTIVIVLLVGLGWRVHAQNDLLIEDSSGVDFQQILQQIEREQQLKFYFDSTQLPRGSWKIGDSDFTLADFQKVLDLYHLSAISYNDYVVAIIPEEVAGGSFSPEYYSSIRNLRSDSLESSHIPVGDPSQIKPSPTADLVISVKDDRTQQPLVGCFIDILGTEIRLVTDVEGKAKTEIELGSYEFLTSSIGYVDQLHKVVIYDDGPLSLEIFENVFTLGEVVVVATLEDEPQFAAQAGLASISSRRIKETPSFLGEPDIIKNLLHLPGVISTGESAPGYHVRGGNVDQNLVLVDEMLLFNTTHLFGLFGALHPDLVGGVRLYKGSMPAQYGGRSASAMLVDMKTADKESLKMTGGVSPVSANLSLDIPIFPNKGSILFGGRTTYSDWVLKRINIPDIQESDVRFYDLQMRYHHELSNRSDFVMSGYLSNDAFRFSDQFYFDYQLEGLSAQWQQELASRWTSTTALVTGAYHTSLTDLQAIVGPVVDRSIDYQKIKELISYNHDGELQFQLGGEGIFYELQGPREPKEGGDPELSDRGWEMGYFIEGIYGGFEKLAIMAGLRFSSFRKKGPGSILYYGNQADFQKSAILDTLILGPKTSLGSHHTFEPRISARWHSSDHLSFACGYAATAQYIFQITNHDTPLPTDRWQLSDRYLEPIRSHNFSLSTSWNSAAQEWSVTLGSFWRKAKGIRLSRDFADIDFSEYLELETLSLEGRSYGIEIELKKQLGKVTGTSSYTFSHTRVRSGESIDLSPLNHGDWFSANHDKPHNLVTSVVYRINNRHKFAANFVYSTGRPLTAPVGFFNTLDNIRVPIYSERNELRIPNYHRLDISYTLGQGHRRNKKWRHHWIFGIYNVYGRRNAYSIYFDQKAFSNVQANRLSVLGSAFPSITYGFSFNAGENE